MELRDFNLKDHMLHKPPMLLVDKVLKESGKKAETSFLVPDSCIFLDENNILQRAALIEIAAQSFAAADIYQRQKSGRELTKGFLVSVRDFKFTGDVRAGDEIFCYIEEINEIAQMHVVEAEMYVNDVRIAGGELRIFEIAG